MSFVYSNQTTFIFIILFSVSLALDSFSGSNQGNLKYNQQLDAKINTTISETNSRYNRQLDTDVESRFHINANTIIRTGESRVLGAKYVNETILPSNHDCLTKCLETPNCNAAVYEEKISHTCYMFDCGIPPKFLCKFTQHDSFVSSLLKISQHSYDLRQWGSKVKQEKEEMRTTEIQTTLSPASIVRLTSVASVVQPKNITQPENPCHHYQFKCINSSECIAIYNVCDGIPQCPDGSDESLDLKCHEKNDASIETKKIVHKPIEPPHSIEHKLSELKPVSEAPAQPTPSVRPPQTVHALKPNDVSEDEQNKMDPIYTEKQKSIWLDRPTEKIQRENYYHRNDEEDGLGSPFVHKHSQFVAANDPHVEGLNRWSNDYDQYPSRPIPAEPQYTPFEGNYQRTDDQYLPNPLSPEYESGKSYDGYRRDEGPSYWSNQEPQQDNAYPAQEYPQASLRTLNKPNNYPDKESLYTQQLSRTAAQYPEMVKHRLIHKPIDMSPSMPQNRASEIEEYKARRYPMHRPLPYRAYEEAIEKQLASYPDMKQKVYDASRNVEEPAYSNDDLIRASLVNQLPMELDRPHNPYQYEKQFENNEEIHQNQHERPKQIEQKVNTNNKNDALGKVAAKIVPPINPKPAPTPKSVQRTVLDFKMSVTELYQATRTHSQETNSAILALVMGLVITSLLFLFLACRIKTIRKRMSRKGRALAHDADYLVNGMYL
ncbi:hypothetical protein JTE90_001652 [Oedothorax gibbosus]|uniref:MANSC domain-containing protein n=1 Tax=Oedothorax gibbosus TaxID=931172 RepID=A0AAV6VPR1_9ARAC|nr:hypothetical protein JTE90_001652 [Oedothorax gibbosus]